MIPIAALDPLRARVVPVKGGEGLDKGRWRVGAFQLHTGEAIAAGEKMGMVIPEAGDQHLPFEVNHIAVHGRRIIAHVDDLITFDGHTGCGGQGAVARPYFSVDEDFISV